MNYGNLGQYKGRHFIFTLAKMLHLLMFADLIVFLQSQLESLSTETVKHLLLHSHVFPYVTAVHAYFITCKLRPNLKNQHWLFSMLTKYD
jgi:hypothetical protein